MRTIIISFVFLVGCGSSFEYSDPHITVDGLTLFTSDVQFDKELTSVLIQDVEDSVNKYYPGLEIRPLIKQYNLIVLPQPYEQIKVGGAYFRGNQTIYIAIPTDDMPKEQQCAIKTYTLGHELLHFVDWVYLNKGDAHNTPHLFFMGTTRDKYSDTAEYDIWIDFASQCSYSPEL